MSVKEELRGKLQDLVDSIGTHVSTPVKNFDFFLAEKWKIASDRGGSGNTAHIDCCPSY
ncbi:MAG: hypothetical protein LBU17_11315 [Treponema sp.]|jgi:hypothetical protein|nr:hypothetical protein [Treponema sp.]